MALKTPAKIIRDCFTILDIMDQIGSVDTQTAAKRLQGIFLIPVRDAFEIVYFWENNNNRLKIN